MKKQLFFLTALLCGLIVSTQVLADVNDGLVAYYPFNGNANDESANSNNGTVHGASLVADRFGNPSSAYQFDGVDDFIEIPNSATVSVFDTLTVLAWIKTNDNVKTAIVDKNTNRDSAGIRSGWRLISDDTDFSVRFGLVSPPDDTGQDYYSGIDISDGTWHLVGMSWDDSADTVNLFVDGTIVATSSEDRSINSNTRSITIGKWDGLNDLYYNGIIDDVRIYNRAISEAEMESLYTSVAATSLAAYYPFNGNANDESGNDNHGAVYGATIATDRHGNANSAYEFDGVDDYIEVTDSPSLNVYDQFSIFAWIKTNSGEDITIISKQTFRDCGGVRTGWQLKTYESVLRGTVGVGTSPNDALIRFDSQDAVNDGEWHHVGISWDDANDTAKVFIDGQLAESYIETSTVTSNSLPVLIGKFQCYGGLYYSGLIDDIRLYNISLSSDDVLEIYTDEVPQTADDSGGTNDNTGTNTDGGGSAGGGCFIMSTSNGL